MSNYPFWKPGMSECFAHSISYNFPNYEIRLFTFRFLVIIKNACATTHRLHQSTNLSWNYKLWMCYVQIHIFMSFGNNWVLMIMIKMQTFIRNHYISGIFASNCCLYRQLCEHTASNYKICGNCYYETKLYF